MITSFYQKLLAGVDSFYRNSGLRYRKIFKKIARHQNPHIMFITCADSRVVPNLITDNHPGELFVLRNIGNMVPIYNPAILSSEAAAVEYALSKLQITDIIICGHSSCGAIAACCQFSDDLPSHLLAWIQVMREPLACHGATDHNDVAKTNIVQQLHNLRTYPQINEQIATKRLQIHGWFFDIATSHIYEWNHEERKFSNTPI